MRTLLSRLCIGSLLLTIVAIPANAQTYPSRPIRVIDPFTAGGSTDLMARLIGQKLTERLGQPVIVDNRPGAGGNLAAELVAKSAPDGYTLFIGGPTLAPSVTLFSRLGYDVAKDFAYVTAVGSGAYVMVGAPTLSAKSVRELIALAKAKQGQLSYGSGGVGSALHLIGELLKSRADINILHVPYKGAAPVMAAVGGNEVHIGFSSLATALPFIKSGRVNAIAVTGAKRAKAMPDLPTIDESGYPCFDVTPYWGFLAPAATPT